MIHALQTKIFTVIEPAAIVNGAAFTTNEVDTIGFDYATFKFHLGATDIAFTLFQVTETDTTGSGQVAIAELVSVGTTGDGRLPQAGDSDTIFTKNIDLKARQRFLDLNATIDTGTLGAFASCICILSRAKIGPLTAAQQGLAGRQVV